MSNIQNAYGRELSDIEIKSVSGAFQTTNDAIEYIRLTYNGDYEFFESSGSGGGWEINPGAMAWDDWWNHAWSSPEYSHESQPAGGNLAVLYYISDGGQKRVYGYAYL